MFRSWEEQRRAHPAQREQRIGRELNARARWSLDTDDELARIGTGEIGAAKERNKCKR